MKESALDAPALFCSTHSLSLAEPLEGTASQADIWLLLEYNGPWEKRAFESSLIPEAAKTKLAGFLNQAPKSRLLLIRQPPRDPLRLQAQEETWTPNPDGKITFYLALPKEHQPALYAFRLDSYEDLLALDLPAIAAEAPSFNSYLSQERLFLVCTNGRRDACCARTGVGLYQALLGAAQAKSAAAGEAAAPFSLWQSTHQGGHRFAPNVVCFPHGIYYGRVSPDQASDLLDSDLHGNVYLPNLRGRVCYADPVQAAEIFLRRETGETSLSAYRLIEAVALDGSDWRVRFSSAQGFSHELVIWMEETGTPVVQSCGSGKTVPLIRPQLKAYKVRSAE